MVISINIYALQWPCLDNLYIETCGLCNYSTHRRRKGGWGGWSPPNIFLEGAEPHQYFRPDSCWHIIISSSPKCLKALRSVPPPILMPLIRLRYTPTNAHPVHLSPTNLAKNVEVKLIDLIKFGEPFSLQRGRTHTKPPPQARSTSAWTSEKAYSWAMLPPCGLAERTLLNLPLDMTLDSSLAASFFSATFRILQQPAITAPRAHYPAKVKP